MRIQKAAIWSACAVLWVILIGLRLAVIAAYLNHDLRISPMVAIPVSAVACCIPILGDILVCWGMLGALHVPWFLVVNVAIVWWVVVLAVGSIGNWLVVKLESAKR